MTSQLNTIGYEGSSIDDFVSTLLLAGIELVIDVRDVPLSRKKGFSKRGLDARLASHGIGYEHLKGLGDPKDGRIAAREGRFDDFRRIYGAHLATEVAQADLATAISLSTTKKACLLCFERDHRECHRLAVATEMSKRTGLRINHLGVRVGAAKARAHDHRVDSAYAFVG